MPTKFDTDMASTFFDESPQQQDVSSLPLDIQMFADEFQRSPSPDLGSNASVSDDSSNSSTSNRSSLCLEETLAPSPSDSMFRTGDEAFEQLVQPPPRIGCLSLPAAATAAEGTGTPVKQEVFPPLQPLQTAHAIPPVPKQAGAEAPSPSAGRGRGRKRKRTPVHKDSSDADATDLIKEAELKKKRLARKAELARLSRRKKKQRMDMLEKQVAVLERELAQARAQHQQDQKTIADLRLASQRLSSQAAETRQDMGTTASIRQAIANMTTGSDPEAALASLLKEMEQHTTAATQNIQRMQTFVQPNINLEFLQWVLTRNDKFYQDPNGLFQSLFSQELVLDKEQIDELLRLRDTMNVQIQTGQESRIAFAQFNAYFRVFSEQRNQNTRSMLQVMTPTQVAKLFNWIHRFGHVCVKLSM